MPYRANGICFATTEEAFSNWSGQFPIRGFDSIKNTVWVTSINSHVANADGSFTYQVSHFDGTGAPVLINAGGFFESCTQITEGTIMELSSVQGSQIAGVILLVWAIAWIFRQVIRTLNVGKNEGNQNE